MQDESGSFICLMFLISLFADEVNAWNKSNNGEENHKRFDYWTLFSGSRLVISSVHLKIFTHSCYVCPGNKITSDIQIASFVFLQWFRLKIFNLNRKLQCEGVKSHRERPGLGLAFGLCLLADMLLCQAFVPCLKNEKNKPVFLMFWDCCWAPQVGSRLSWCPEAELTN